MGDAYGESGVAVICGLSGAFSRDVVYGDNLGALVMDGRPGVQLAGLGMAALVGNKTEPSSIGSAEGLMNFRKPISLHRDWRFWCIDTT
jgi:hypothetical protein